MRWRSAITLAVLIAVLVGGAWYGWNAFESPVDSSTASPGNAHACTRWKTYPAGTNVDAKAVSVSVYNAGTVAGQAGRVLAALHSRGFLEGVAANPPAGVEARNVTIVTPTPRSPLISLVKSQFAGKVHVSVADPLSNGVDVVIGPHYAGINTKAPTSLKLVAPVRVCRTHAS